MRKRISVKINGEAYESEVEPRLLLVHYLRDELDLTGTHIGCVEGKCGACTVMINGETVKSCLMFAVQVDGSEIMTVEGLAKNGKLHPLQEAFWEHHGLHCGYCTPGILLSACQLLKDIPEPTEDDIKIGISGNLCRCTGYVNIFKAIKAAAEKIRGTEPSIAKP